MRWWTPIRKRWTCAPISNNASRNGKPIPNALKPQFSAKRKKVRESMTDLERCDQEQKEMLEHPDIANAPAWLVVLGIEDWEMEKKLIIAEGQ